MADPYYQTTNQTAYYQSGNGGGPSQTQYYQQQHQQQLPPPSHQYLATNQQQQQTSNNFAVAAKMTAPSSSTGESNLYMVLVGMSDSFLSAAQPRLAIHCLESVLTIKSQDLSIATSLHIQLRTRLNLCRLYLDYTVNTNQLVNAHVEKSMLIIQNLAANDELKYEATLTLYELFERQRDLQAKAKLDIAAGTGNGVHVDPAQMTSLFSLELVRKVLEASKGLFPLWHVRILYLIGNICMKDKDYTSAAYFMSLGINYSANNPQLAYPHILFILSKGLIHLVQKNTNELQATMQPCASLIENYKTPNGYQVELLKIFFLVLQVTYFIQCGQAKSVRNTLKSLQHYIAAILTRFETSTADSTAAEWHAIAGGSPFESFYWLHKDHLGILANLLNVTHLVQTGAYQKASELVVRSLATLDRLRARETNHSSTSNITPSSLLASARFLLTSSSFVTNRLQMLLVENQARCSVALGQRALAIKQINNAFKLCQKDSRLFQLHGPQLHCLLGIYALSTNNKEAAISQFNQALKQTSDTDLWLLCAMNAALCYTSSATTSTSSKSQMLSILENVMPEKIQTQSTSLNAFAHYFKAVKFYFLNNLQMAQQSLREAVLLANSEDLASINANALVFTGHINMLSGQYQESFSMLTNGLSLADQMGDITLRSYANSLLKDLYSHYKDPRESEAIKLQTELEQRNAADLNEAVYGSLHSLINWNGPTLPSTMSLSSPSMTTNSTNSQQQSQQQRQQQQPQQQQQQPHQPQNLATTTTASPNPGMSKYPPTTSSSQMTVATASPVSSRSMSGDMPPLAQASPHQQHHHHQPHHQIQATTPTPPQHSNSNHNQQQHHHSHQIRIETPNAKMAHSSHNSPLSQNSPHQPPPQQSQHHTPKQHHPQQQHHNHHHQQPQQHHQQTPPHPHVASQPTQPQQPPAHVHTQHHSHHHHHHAHQHSSHQSPQQHQPSHPVQSVTYHPTAAAQHQPQSSPQQVIVPQQQQQYASGHHPHHHHQQPTPSPQQHVAHHPHHHPTQPHTHQQQQQQAHHHHPHQQPQPQPQPPPPPPPPPAQHHPQHHHHQIAHTTQQPHHNHSQQSAQSGPQQSIAQIYAAQQQQQQQQQQHQQQQFMNPYGQNFQPYVHQYGPAGASGAPGAPVVANQAAAAVAAAAYFQQQYPPGVAQHQQHHAAGHHVIPPQQQQHHQQHSQHRSGGGAVPHHHKPPN